MFPQKFKGTFWNGPEYDALVYSRSETAATTYGDDVDDCASRSALVHMMANTFCEFVPHQSP